MAKNDLDQPLHCDLWIDLNSADSYLAVNALRKAMARTERPLQVNLRPFFEAKTGTAGQTAERTVAEARRRGIELNQDALDGGTGGWPGDLPAHKLLAYAREIDQNAGVTDGPGTLELKLGEALLRSRFEMGENLASPELVISVGQDLGIPGEESFEVLNDPGLEDEVVAQFQLGSHLGVTSVPILVVADTYQVPGSLTVEEYENVLATVAKEAI